MAAKPQPPVTPETRRAEICRTAARMIRDRGFDATSVADIARGLGMTKAGLYHYFPSKEALLFEIITFGLERVREEVIVPTRKIRNPEERLRQIVIRHARITTRAQGAVAQLFDETRALPTAGQKAVRLEQRAYVALIRKTLGELDRIGRLGRIDPTVAAFSIIGMVLWLPRWFRAGGRLSEEQAAAEIAKLALASVLSAAPLPRGRAPRQRTMNRSRVPT